MLNPAYPSPSKFSMSESKPLQSASLLSNHLISAHPLGTNYPGNRTTDPCRSSTPLFTFLLL